MRTQRVVGHQLASHLIGQRLVQTSADIEALQLASLAGWVLFQLDTLARQVGFLGIRLGMDGDEFTRRHRHGAGNQARTTGQQDQPVLGAGRGGGLAPPCKLCRPAAALPLSRWTA